jgi:phospholipase/carboxylesterase
MKELESEDEVRLEPDAPAQASVIWLHGLGADGYDFVPIAPELRLSLPVRFIFPHAPARPVTINGGMRMRAWYDIFSLSRQDRQDESGIRDSAARVQKLIEAESAAGIPPGRIVLAGFSQGGAIALHAGLRQPQALAGILALSTYLPLAEKLPAELTAGGRATPILMCHGSHDNVVPLFMGAGSRDILAQLDREPEWREYPMQHQVCAEEIADIAAWMEARLAPA